MYSEAIEIMRYVQKKRPIVSDIALTQAMFLAQFSFPLEVKFEVIDRVVQEAHGRERTIYSLKYFGEAFRRAESEYHKGAPPAKGGMMKVSDILGIRE